MRPREIPLLLCAVGVPLWIGAASRPLPKTCPDAPSPQWSSDWRALAGLALLGVLARVLAQRSFLLAHVGEDRPIAEAETYRGMAKTNRTLPDAVAKDWKLRSGMAIAAAVLTTAISWVAKPSLWGAVATACASFGGAAVFLRLRRGHASLLYLPLLAAMLLSLPSRPASSAVLPLCALLLTGPAAIAEWLRMPLGGYELDDHALGALHRATGTLGASFLWLALGQGFVVSVLPLPAYAYEGQFKLTEGNARAIRNAVNRWRGAKGGTDCPTIAQLVADKEIDSASKTDDSYGSNYRITCTEDDVFVVSPGADCLFGTADDISVPKGPAN